MSEWGRWNTETVRKHLNLIIMKPGKNLLKTVWLLFVCLAITSPQSGKAEKSPAPRIVNIINFIRQTEPRSEEVTDEVLYQTVVEQVKQLNAHRLKGTFLLQYDALINPKYQQLLKNELYPGSEIGGWWEITQPHVEAAGLKWRGRYAWDWHADVGFATGYTPEEREKLVDVYMEKFKSVFGKYPTAIGSWFIDAHTLGYMYDKYHITASCNCKDQIGTDGYTLWGGYWNQAYYPSRRNAYMPAQTEKGQIPVPVFRMLGSDPIYQYDSGLGGSVQSVVSLEPVYTEGGGSRAWVEWFFHSMFEEPCLSFAYTQVGQENSFTWDAMKQGLEIQVPILEELQKEKKIRVETLTESGEWFKEQFPVTPPTAVTTLSDNRGNDRKTVWYNSRFYRTNLLWEGSSFRFRDIHLFNEAYASDYLTKAGTSNQCVYTTLPFVDGCMWSTAGQLAGLRLNCKDASGKMTEAKGGTPSVEEKGQVLQVSWPLENRKAVFHITFQEDCMELACDSEDKDFAWNLELTALPGAELPFTTIADQAVSASQKNFDYQIACRTGRFVDLRKEAGNRIFKIEPAQGKVILFLNCAGNRR